MGGNRPDEGTASTCLTWPSPFFTHRTHSLAGESAGLARSQPIQKGKKMLPMKALRIALGDLLAANVATLAAATANKIALIIAPFGLNENYTLADLTLATFTGSTPKSGASGAQQVGIDPVTGEQKITILAPVGGWRWECSVTPGAAETVYGYCLLDDTLSDVLGLAELGNPVVIAEATQFLDLGAVEITFVLTPMS